MYKLCFYVPESHLELVKTVLFNTGAGSIGDHQKCCWQVLGKGQFQPNDYAKPFIGDLNKLAIVDEYRVETVCADIYIEAAIAALKSAHPYEEIAFDVLKVEQF
ncbi:MAG: hypothetical protein ACI90U_001663 [Pseudomonadales bacterium]|jgi:hypothetical protein